MAQTGKPRSGKNGRLQINGTTVIGCHTFQIADGATWDDVTNFETQGYAEGVFGIFSAAVALELYWNAAQNPFENPPNLKKGQILDTVRLYTNVTDIQFYSFAKLAIVNCTLGCPTRGVVTYSVQAQSDGPYTEPTGSV